MGWEAELNKQRREQPQLRQVTVVCPDPATLRDFAACLERLAASLAAYDDFTAFAEKLDENAPEEELAKQWGPRLLAFVVQMQLIYPDRGQYSADIQTLNLVQIREGGRG